MKFCENCRRTKNWPNSAVVSNDTCEVCRISGECYDVPAVMTVPESQRTLEQKAVYKIMQESFRDKANSLTIMTLGGKVDNLRTPALRDIFVYRSGEVDWYASYNLRLKAQEGYIKSEQIKRDRRKI